MYLWKFELDLSNYNVQQGLRDRQKMHQMVTGLFGASRHDASLLYRYIVVERKVQLYMYSSIPMREEAISKDFKFSGGREVSDWLDGMKNGQIRNFDLLTMPSKKIKMKNQKNSRRRLLLQPEERMKWLQRKAEQNGFAILSVREDPAERIFGIHPDERGGRLYLNTWRYSGVIQIQNEKLFRSAVENGIGPEKAYGLGMILLA